MGSPRQQQTSARRSLLFVPGVEARKIEKAAATDADVLILDLEDSVAVDAKREARRIVAEALSGLDFGEAEVAVRVNPPDSPFFVDDVAAVLEAGARLLMLPKCDSRSGLVSAMRRIARWEGRLAQAAPERAGADPLPGSRGVRVLALIESARGITNAGGIADGVEWIDALCFGHVDFATDMGLANADASHPVVRHARCALSIAARASEVEAIDTVHPAFRDEVGFAAAVRESASLGFSGRLCIHPAQVPIVNEVFTPTPEQIAYARRILEAAEEASAAGRGVFAVDGRMIDAPVIATQERLLARAVRTGAVPASV